MLPNPMATQDIANWRLCQFAATAKVNFRTVKRWLSGLPLRPSTRERLDAAARELAIPSPQKKAA